jgi:hypothetical protein
MQSRNSIFLKFSFCSIFRSIWKKAEPIVRCGSIRIQTPFYFQTVTHSSILNHILLCEFQKIYFRTSLDIFQIASIDYLCKLIMVSQFLFFSVALHISYTSNRRTSSSSSAYLISVLQLHEQKILCITVYLYLENTKENGTIHNQTSKA